MRKAVLLIRIWNETRSLADLPTEDLDSVLDGAFNFNRESKTKKDAATTLDESSTMGEARSAQMSAEHASDIDSLKSAAKRIRSKAYEKGWISPKSTKALDVLEKSERVLTSSERNALNFLLDRMRTDTALQNEVLLLSRALVS